ncbi:MAG: hypothetical protein LBR33_11165 [Propionibacteriaceae bacterium]|jgi:hypothetical protein|nr:hypothetical protein [Propionibacteriaceae bacterium]
MTAAESWAGALARALTGQALDVPADAAGDGAAFLVTLAGLGWDGAALAAHAEAAWAAGDPWPHPDPEAAHRFGPARWHAALAGLTHRLGLDTVTQPPSHRTTLTADERRLMADKPPHHLL